MVNSIAGGEASGKHGVGAFDKILSRCSAPTQMAYPYSAPKTAASSAFWA